MTTAPNAKHTARAGSAYPATIEELVPQARELAAQLGEMPSRRRVMRELHIGTDKARDVLARLDATRLHLVTDTAAPATEAKPAGPEPTTPAEPEPASAPGADSPTPPAEPLTATSAAPTAPLPSTAPAEGRPVSAKPLVLLVFPAMVAIWAGWVGLGTLTGFGVVHPLPGIWDHFTINTAITLPVGVETYAAFALRVWLSGRVPARAKRFARWSVIASLTVGALGQIAYHLMNAAHVTAAPWPITTLVSCLPVAVLGMGAALAHLIRDRSE
jgi:hypothetical protein